MFTKKILILVLYSLFITSLFFPLRKVFFSNSAYLTGAYSDFTSFSLYLSDILLFITWWVIILPRGGTSLFLHHVVRNLKWLYIWLILGFFWHFQQNSSLNWYFLLKYAELIVAYGTTAYISSEYPVKSMFSKLFIILGSIQSILALSQFWLQKSLELKYLGENLLNPTILGVAKIVSSGTTYIRGYGTFPHPNLLSAFLITTILFCCYNLTQAKSIKSKVLYGILLILNTLGLTVTFSRGAFIALSFGLIIFFGFSLYNNYKNQQTLLNKPLILLLAFSILISLTLFKPYLISRKTFSDSATMERKEYNQIGVKIIKDRPIFGTGIGESVLHMEQYSGKRLETWEKQPVHNYFLLSAAELGVPGALILIWIFWSHFKILLTNLKSKFNIYSVALLSILISFFVLMFFDHYFYTIQQTQLLLWVFLGIIASKTKTPQAGE